MRTVAIAATANRTALTTAGSTASPAMSLLPRSVSPISPLARATVNSDGADDVHAAGAARRLPAGRCSPGQCDRHDPDRHVHVEDPAPGRREDGGQRGPFQSEPLDGAFDVDPAQDRRPDERPGGHPQERQGTDDAERARSLVALEEMRRGGRGDRHEHPAADALHEARRDELVEVLRRPGQRRTHDEYRERAHEQAPRTPQVGKPAGQGHRHHVREQVGVDDPARLAELDPDRPTGRIDEVHEDRRERDGRDDQLEAGQEHADPEDDEEHQRRTAIHRASLPAGRR